MPPTIGILTGRCDPGTLSQHKVTYQAAQFLHMEAYAEVLWADRAVAALRGETPGVQLDAVVVFDEHALLTDPMVRSLLPLRDTLLVFVTHDFWCHPLQVAQTLGQQRRVLMVLRHESSRRLFAQIAPGVPMVVQRPGVEISIFHPRPEPKRFDVILGGSETPDYPVRVALNQAVRDHADGYGWKVLDMTGRGLMSNPPGSQLEYAPALASAKVAPTGTNRGGTRGAKLVMQYFDLSAARAEHDDPFYGLTTPEVTVQTFDTAGVTPRYLETLASRTLLIGDLPECDDQDWYRDKMVVVDHRTPGGQLAELIDHWVRSDDEREQLCDRAHRSVLESESSQHRARELVELIEARLAA